MAAAESCGSTMLPAMKSPAALAVRRGMWRFKSPRSFGLDVLDNIPLREMGAFVVSAI
jgi:hypothetical protein